jgi:Omp85 superfamily domain
LQTAANNKILSFNKKRQSTGILKISLLACLLLSGVGVKAQFLVVPDSIFATHHTPEAKTYFSRQTDITDVFSGIFKKTPQQRLDTIAELKAFKLHWSTVPAVGYTLQTGFAALLSENVAFYTSLEHNQKISSISTSVTYSQYNQIIFPFQADIWSKSNKYNFILDWRYMDYPSETFGLGGNTLITDGYNIDFYYAKIHQALLRRVNKNLYAGAGYYLDYFWNVREIDASHQDTVSFIKDKLTKTSVSSGIAFRLIYDSRLNQINPQQGTYVNIVFRPNFTFLGSDNNWQSLLLEFRKYIRFKPSSKNVLALWSYNWLTIGGGEPPYLMLPSTGWDDFFNTGRGYIQSRFRGRDMFYLESEYRFGITNNGLLGGVVFANAESFSKSVTSGGQTVAPGYGVGIRMKLNKFSGANLCVDYGFGTEGSRGIAVNLGEVF